MKILKDNSPQVVKLFEREASALQWLNQLGTPGRNRWILYFFTQQQHPAIPLLSDGKIEGHNLEQWLEQHGPFLNL